MLQLGAGPQGHQAGAAQAEGGDRPLQADPGRRVAAHTAGWAAGGVQQGLDPGQPQLPQQQQAGARQAQQQQRRNHQAASAQAAAAEAAAWDKTVPWSPLPAGLRWRWHQPPQALRRIGGQQGAVLQEAQEEVIPQRAGGGAAAAQPFQQRRAQTRQYPAVAAGHRQLGRAHLAPLERAEQQLAQGLAHGALLDRIQRQHQRQPQPVGQQAVAKPGQPRQPQQGTPRDQRLASAIAQPLAQIGGDRPVQVGEHGAGRQPAEAIGTEVGAQLRQQLLQQCRRRRCALQPAVAAAPQQRRFRGLGRVRGRALVRGAG